MGRRTDGAYQPEGTARGRKCRIEAVAYLRTSSATNVGEDKDSDERQRKAIAAFAKRAGYDLAGEFYDAAVGGAGDVDGRPGFAAMLKRIESNGVRTIIVETANRFARDLIVQETGYAMLRERGIDLIAADSPSAFLDDGPTSKLIRQVLGAVAEFDKTMTVAKLRGARERARRAKGKCEGRKGFAEMAEAAKQRGDTRLAEAIALAKRLHRASPKTGERMSLRKIAAALAKAGHVNVNGREFNPASVKAMIDGPPVAP